MPFGFKFIFVLVPADVIVKAPVRPKILSVIIFAFDWILPLATKLLNVPTLVTFGCDAVVKVPVNNVALNAPVPALKDKFALLPCA